MESVVTLQDVANIVTFIAPGYFAIQVYSLIYTKKDRNFSQLLIESVVYSLPIITLVNIIWENVLGQTFISSLNIAYALLALIVAIGVGLAATFLRSRWPIRTIATKFGFGSPEEDFVKTQLLRIDVKNRNRSVVTVQLKSGAVFSGTIDRLSRYQHNGPNYYYFVHLAWFNENTNQWDERSGGIIVERSEIEYIEMPKVTAKD